MFKKGALAALAVAFAAVPAQSQPAQPLADAAIFVDPVSARGAQISPSGAYVAMIQRNAAGQQIVVVDLNARAARAVQVIAEDAGGYNWLRWKGDNRLVVSATVGMGRQNRDGEWEYAVTRVLAFNRDGSNPIQLFEGQFSRLARGYGSVFFLDDLRSDPDHVLVNAWDNLGTGAWRANIHTGRAERLVAGQTDTIQFITDGVGYPVIRVDGVRNGFEFYRRANGETGWTKFREARRLQAAQNSPDFNVLSAGPEANQVYVLARQPEADLLTLHLFDASTGVLGPALQENAVADASAPWILPNTRSIFATCEFAQRLSCAATEARAQGHLNAVNRFFEGAATVRLVNMSNDGARWLLSVDGPQDPGAYYLYDVASRNLEPIALLYPSIDTAVLSASDVIEYVGRDGASLWAYVTRPASAQGRQAPMVVMPHGGPEARDYWGYDSYAQFLASRGYIVLQPNFRGSIGSGRAFADAGRRQWGRRMQDDVTDAVRHMIATGAVDPQRICIVGASYGGYAALAGVALTPELYRCAISIAGVSDLAASVRSEQSPGSTNLGYLYWVNSIGHPRDDAEQLRQTSPRFLVANITAPVLLMHGEEDDVVDIRQSELMQAAFDEVSRPARLVRFEDEGHYWDAWSRENRLTLYQETERFLATHIGGASSAPVTSE